MIEGPLWRELLEPNLVSGYRRSFRKRPSFFRNALGWFGPSVGSSVCDCENSVSI